MPDRASRRLSIDEAARLIYQTSTPTEQQLSKVRYTVSKGVLEGSAADNWVATESVAAYLAARIVKTSTRRTLAASGTSQDPSAAGARLRSDAAEARELPRVYRGLLRDYLSAVLRRKQPSRSSTAFRAAVLAGQVAIVLFPIVVIACSIAFATAPPPEHTAVEAWIAEHTRKYEILEWFPDEPHQAGGTVVRVRYKYFGDSPKAITTDRRFRVLDDSVTQLSSSD